MKVTHALIMFALLGTLFLALYRADRANSVDIAAVADRDIGFVEASDEPALEEASPEVLFKIHDVKRIKSTEVPPEVSLSYRARREEGIDFLILTVYIENLGQDVVRVAYKGEPKVHFRLSSREPKTDMHFALPPLDAEKIAGSTSLSDRQLLNGDSEQGVIVFQIGEDVSGFTLNLSGYTWTERVYGSEYGGRATKVYSPFVRIDLEL